MSETLPRNSAPATPRDLRPAPHRPQVAPSANPHHFPGRISARPAGGFAPAAHRYQVYLSPGCPRSLRVAITIDLLGLRDSATITFLGLQAETAGAQASLRGAYEATQHRYDGPLTVPALADRWSGRIVSNHTPDILRDLADHFIGRSGAGVARLRPPALVADIDAIGELLDKDITQAAQRAGVAPTPQLRAEALETLVTALDLLDRQLGSGPYVLGDELTAADVDLWVALGHLDAERLHLGADAVHLMSRYERLWSYVRRLHRHPAFHRNLCADRTALMHWRTGCRPESSDPTVPLSGALRTTAA